MSDEYLVIRLHPLSDAEEAQTKLQESADEGFEWLGVIPAADAALVIMKRRKRADKTDTANPYRSRS